MPLGKDDLTSRTHSINNPHAWSRRAIRRFVVVEADPGTDTSTNPQAGRSMKHAPAMAHVAGKKGLGSS